MSDPAPYICEHCQAAIAAEVPGFYNDHSCAEWGNYPARSCECPYQETWCDDCQDTHHPPVGVY